MASQQDTHTRKQKEKDKKYHKPNEAVVYTATLKKMYVMENTHKTNKITMENDKLQTRNEGRQTKVFKGK